MTTLTPFLYTNSFERSVVIQRYKKSSENTRITRLLARYIMNGHTISNDAFLLGEDDLNTSP